MAQSMAVIVLNANALWLQAAMKDPMIAADGYTYERAAIEDWLQNNSVSPVTGDFLAHMRIVPNVLVKNLINDTQQ